MPHYFSTWRPVALCTLMFFSMQAQAELVVIVNANVRIEQLSRDEVVNIFMGRYRRLPNGTSVQPLDVGSESTERRDFYKKLVDKNLAEINAYWARLIFSGKTSPPVVLMNQTEVLERVARDLSVIGYVERENLNSQVKAIYVLPE